MERIISQLFYPIVYPCINICVVKSTFDSRVQKEEYDGHPFEVPRQPSEAIISHMVLREMT